MPPTQPMRLGPGRDRILHSAADLVAAAWSSFDAARDVEPRPEESLVTLLGSSLPHRGVSADRALKEAVAILNTSLAQVRPRFLAYVGSSGLEIGAIADLLAHSYDVNLALDAGSASALEAQTIRWLGEFVGYPSEAGWFTSGGTLSTLSALTAARERALPDARRDGIADTPAAFYTSEESHYSVTRSVELLGHGARSVRAVAIDGQRRMRPEDLRAALCRDVADGVTPVAVVATAGTTLTGAVDPLHDIADVCTQFGVWLHVDGAYGLPAAATAAAPLFAGLALADSVSVDAHKWMFVPKACSAVLTRHPAAFAAAFSHDEAYVPHHDGLPNAVDMTLEYSRPLRALKLWLALRVHGAEQFRSAIETTIGHAQSVYETACAANDLEVLPNPPQLSIVPLRHVVEGCPDLNRHHAVLTDALVADGRVYVSPAVIDGDCWLRPCFTNMRTTSADVDTFIALVREVGRRICPEHGSS